MLLILRLLKFYCKMQKLDEEILGFEIAFDFFAKRFHLLFNDTVLSVILVSEEDGDDDDEMKTQYNSYYLVAGPRRRR